MASVFLSFQKHILITNNEIKLITSLKQKKYRDQEGLFVAEGKKCVSALIDSKLSVFKLLVDEDVMFHHPDAIKVSTSVIQKITSLKNNNGIVGIFHKPDETPLLDKGLTLVLDGVRDPGNLGTIIRLCDWFGLQNLVCSPDTVDCFNSKVVQATMGSLATVSIYYKVLTSYLETTRKPIFGAVMEGVNVYAEKLPSEAILIMGNEGNGISESVSKYINQFVTIPNFSTSMSAESLNVATATGILLSEFRRTTGR